MMKFALTITLLVFFIQCCYCQDRISIANSDSTHSDEYFKLYKDYLSISPYLGIGHFALDFDPAGNDVVGTTNFSTNASYRLGLGLCYNDIAVFAGFGTSMTYIDSSMAEPTKITDYSISLINQGWVTRLSYRSCDGLVDYTNYQEKVQQKQKLNLLNDVKLKQYHLSTGYFFRNKKFDYNTIVNMAGNHNKSSNSFNLEGAIDYYQFSADSSWIPFRDRSKFDANIVNVRGFNTASLLVAPGWAGIAKLNNWFFMLKANLGMRINWVQSVYVNGKQSTISTDPDAILRICFGYNGPQWFLVMDTEAESFLIKTPEFTCSNSFSQVYFTLGWRFYAPKVGNVLRKVPLVRRFV
jgi:hypothetical protein